MHSEYLGRTVPSYRLASERERGGNPITVSIGKMLTVMGDQDNTIRTLSRILGRDHNDQDLHDMHNELFGGMLGESGLGREGMELWHFK